VSHSVYRHVYWPLSKSEHVTISQIQALIHAGKRELLHCQNSRNCSLRRRRISPLESRAALWLDVAEASGVQLPKTYHPKPPCYSTIEPQSIRRACQDGEDMFNSACEQEKRLTDKQATTRDDWLEDNGISASPESVPSCRDRSAMRGNTHLDISRTRVQFIFRLRRP
jgi:hypothetical protein